MRALRIRVAGVVQGVGFRPFVYRLAQSHRLSGWVFNQGEGVEIHAEGEDITLSAFVRELREQTPPAADIRSFEVSQCEPERLTGFVIRGSVLAGTPVVPISPDLPVCEACLAELFNPADSRYLYPYINCTNCGPRFTVIESLPYDRSRTTMRHWQMDTLCATQYSDPADRRFHAQPVACPGCGPRYHLHFSEPQVDEAEDSIKKATRLLRAGNIVAIKGIGGYHLSCDARSSVAVLALRNRKFRKEKPFAVMVRDLAVARDLVHLSQSAEELLLSTARPIVLAPAKLELTGVAPETRELGIMLPYAPLHHLLFAAGAPEILVMTSGNRSSEPIAYRDDEAQRSLAGLADALLVGERPIARRVDDSVARAGVFGAVILRRSRGYAPGAVAHFPTEKPILALGADLKNTITLVVNGQAFVSQHIGDLDHLTASEAFQETVRDLVEMYDVNPDDLTVVHDAHPQYVSTSYALELPAAAQLSVQHHRAHIASVMAERHAWNRRAVGISFDGTGYGDDGTIWGGEFFTGGMDESWARALHLRNAFLPGGDAAARFPVQCAAGFLSQLDHSADFLAAPFCFPARYATARELIAKRIRTFETSSMGRLFDTVAALLGFDREITFEGQAAIWLEQIASNTTRERAYPFPILDHTLDFRPLLRAIAQDRLRGCDIASIARAFHAAVAATVWEAATMLCEKSGSDLIVLSGGVFQNELLLSEIQCKAEGSSLEIWTNRAVPANDGGISFGQAAIAATCLRNVS